MRSKAAVCTGDVILPGDLLGYIKIGILLTPVVFEADTGHFILAEVLAADRALVGYGAPLFRIVQQ